MTMHLVKGLTSLSTKKRKTTVTKRQKELLVTVNANRAGNGLPLLSTLTAPKREEYKFKPLRVDNGPRRAGSLAYQNLSSKKDTAYCASISSIMDPRNLEKESPEVRAAIIAKSQRLAPAYNKGAVQYITDETDATDLGRKK